MPSCVLAYSGGLDTSVILGWLMDEGFDVHCVYVDLGQPCEDRDAMRRKAANIGAKSVRFVDAQLELCRDFAFPVSVCSTGSTRKKGVLFGIVLSHHPSRIVLKNSAKNVRLAVSS